MALPVRMTLLECKNRKYMMNMDLEGETPLKVGAEFFF